MNQPEQVITAGEKRNSIWDNDLPPGDSPPMSKGPLVATIALYAAWMVFLISMMIVRLVTT